MSSTKLLGNKVSYCLGLGSVVLASNAGLVGLVSSFDRYSVNHSFPIGLSAMADAFRNGVPGRNPRNDIMTSTK